MTRGHGWTNDSGHTGRDPGDQRPPVPYPWEPIQSQSSSQNGGAGMSPAGASQPIAPQPPYQPQSPQPQPQPPVWNPMGGDNQDSLYPLRSPNSGTGQPGADGRGRQDGHDGYDGYDGHGGDGRAPAVKLPPTPTAPPAFDDADDDLQRSITTRMARLSRNPEYLQAERLLANRRRARARLS